MLKVGSRIPLLSTYTLFKFTILNMLWFPLSKSSDHDEIDKLGSVNGFFFLFSDMDIKIKTEKRRN